jgi:hypothetical protein
MCMNCNSGGKITKKKIAVLSSAAAGMAATTYVAFILTHNPALAVTMPALLSLAACPAMCVGMGGAFWLVTRFSGKNRNKNNDQLLELKEAENDESSCCSSDDNQQVTRTTSTIPKSKNEDDIEASPYYQQKHIIEFEN